MDQPIQAKLLDAGIAAYDYAIAAGQRLNIKTFKAGTRGGYIPADDQKDILGDLVFGSTITEVEVLNPNGVMFTCHIPKNIPSGGGIEPIGELMLFSDNGTAIAVIVYPEIIPKYSTYDIDLQAVLVHARAAAVINLVVSERTSLPSSYLADLPPPDTSTGTAWTILDGSHNEVDRQHSDGPSMAVRYLAESQGLQWGFVGQSRVYYGSLPNIADSRSEFTLDPVVNGFWLNSDEIVIIASGEEARRAKFNSALSKFTLLDKPFSVLTTLTDVSIWRANTNETALPLRKEVPPHYTLHPGRDEKTSSSLAVSSGTLRMKYKRIKFDGTTRVFSLGLTTDQVKDATVFIDGLAIDPESYAVGDYLAFNTVYPASKYADVYMWYLVPTTGALVEWVEDAIDATGVTNTFATSGPIASFNDCMVFLNGKLLSPPEMYTVQPTSVVFATNPIGKLCILRYSQPAQTNTVGRINSYAYVSNGAQQTITVPFELNNRSMALIFKNGAYLPKSEYSVNESEISYNDIPANGTIFEIQVFGGSSISYVPGIDASVNTGPVWRDPAGFFTEPCLFRPHQTDYISKSGDAKFAIPKSSKPSSSSYAWVFINGLIQQPDKYELRADLLEVTLKQPLRAGYRVTMLTFESIESTGYVTKFDVYNPSASEKLSGVFYLANPPSDGTTVIVYAGGLLQQRTLFSLSSTMLSAGKALNPDIKYQVYVYRTERSRDYTTEARRISTLARSGAHYRTSEETYKSNTMFYVGGLLQSQGSYNYNNREASFDEVPLSGLRVDLMYLYSGLPRTRLVTRGEMEQFVPKSGAVLEGVLEQPTPPVGSSDLVNLQYMQTQMQKLQQQMDILAAQAANRNY